MADGTAVGVLVECVDGDAACALPDESVSLEPAAAAGKAFCRVCSICVTSLSSLNCASCPTNCVGSMGLSGSWFCNCATSSCRNMLLRPCEVGSPLLPVEEVEFVPEGGGVFVSARLESGLRRAVIPILLGDNAEA